MVEGDDGVTASEDINSWQPRYPTHMITRDHVARPDRTAVESLMSDLSVSLLLGDVARSWRDAATGGSFSSVKGGSFVKLKIDLLSLYNLQNLNHPAFPLSPRSPTSAPALLNSVSQDV